MTAGNYGRHKWYQGRECFEIQKRQIAPGSKIYRHPVLLRAQEYESVEVEQGTRLCTESWLQCSMRLDTELWVWFDID